MDMKRQHMIELYNLLTIYAETYRDTACDIPALMRETAERYFAVFGKDIAQEKNPRGGGRPRTIPESDREQIRQLRSTGLSLRQIAAETGHTVGFVHKVVRENEN